jgi:hypothetical protein
LLSDPDGHDRIGDIGIARAGPAIAAADDRIRPEARVTANAPGLFDEGAKRSPVSRLAKWMTSASAAKCCGFRDGATSVLTRLASCANFMSCRALRS